MRYFIKNFEKVYNKDWPFGHFPAYEYYPNTGTHIGNDFKVVVGTFIFAPIDGEILKAEFNKYKGNTGIFVFKHKNIEWGLELCHLRELPKKRLYKEGETIAFSGNTGSTGTGPHLHAVLHRDAMVTKNYRRLQSREDFLKLEKEGAVVNCFDWFCSNIEETEKSESAKQKDQKIKKTEQSKEKKVKTKDSFFVLLFNIFFKRKK